MGNADAKTLRDIFERVDLLKDNELTSIAIDHLQRAFYKRQVWRRRRWLGVACHQNPLDQWIIQEIIYDLKPDFILETGTRHGGSAVYYASIMEFLGKGKVITVDIKAEHLSTLSGTCTNEVRARDLPLFKDRVVTLTGSSTDEHVLSAMRTATRGSGTTMVILDSNHDKDHVLRELQAYSEFITPGSYLIVQDTNLGGHPIRWPDGPGPWEATEEFLRSSDRFEVDRTREELMFTWHPGGYLRARY
jgi:cephalosporin hydroxylase